MKPYPPKSVTLSDGKACSVSWVTHVTDPSDFLILWIVNGLSLPPFKALQMTAPYHLALLNSLPQGTVIAQGDKIAVAIACLDTITGDHSAYLDSVPASIVLP